MTLGSMGDSWYYHQMRGSPHNRKVNTMADAPFNPEDWDTQDERAAKIKALIDSGKSFEEAWTAIMGAGNVAGFVPDAEAHPDDPDGPGPRGWNRKQAMDPNAPGYDPNKDPSPDPEQFREEYKKQVAEHP